MSSLLKHGVLLPSFGNKPCFLCHCREIAFEDGRQREAEEKVRMMLSEKDLTGGL